MMRIPRSLQLYNSSAAVHMFWRCHNKEFYLSDYRNKKLYMSTIKRSLEYKSTHENIRIHSYCIMDNHSHKCVSYKNSYRTLSNFMRYAHGLFGLKFNKIYNRSGKVADSRPKTSMIQDEKYEMRVHFYIEANPIRSRKMTLAKLRSYKYSSYRFYAYGIRDEYTELLTPPSWYLKLGNTARERQSKYRKLFFSFISIDTKNENFHQKSFIGNDEWAIQKINFIREQIKHNRLEFKNSS